MIFFNVMSTQIDFVNFTHKKVSFFILKYVHILPQGAPELLHLSVKSEIFLGGGLVPPKPPSQIKRVALLGTRRAARGTATRGKGHFLFLTCWHLWYSEGKKKMVRDLHTM